MTTDPRLRAALRKKLGTMQERRRPLEVQRHVVNTLRTKPPGPAPAGPPTAERPGAAATAPDAEDAQVEVTFSAADSEETVVGGAAEEPDDNDTVIVPSCPRD